MNKLARMAMLYDFYGQLLTVKQRGIMELFYSDDLSLSEIAQERGTSRQAVYDILKRTEKILESYEEKLHLVEKFQQQQNKIARIGELVSLAREHENVTYLEKVTEIIGEIIELERK